MLKQQLASDSKSPKEKIPVRNPFNFVEKRHNRKSLKGRFQLKIQTALSGTENTVKTDTGKIIHRKPILGPLFQSEKRHRRETVPTVSAEITPKSRHCLRGEDGKYEKWNGKLRMVQKKTRTETESEDDDDDDDEEEEMPEDAGIVYDTSERDERYELIRTDPENDTLQIHTDGR